MVGEVGEVVGEGKRGDRYVMRGGKNVGFSEMLAGMDTEVMILVREVIQWLEMWSGWKEM